MLSDDVILPSDLSSEELEAIESADNSKTSEELWVKVQQAVKQNINNLDYWDVYLKHFDDRYDQLYSEADKNKIDLKFKLTVNQTYSQLLARFPYLSEYWRRFLVMEYKLNGVEASIEVLKKSIQVFPYSIELWLDYLNALVSEKKGEEEKEITRLEFENCVNYLGYHFNSDPLWDAYIAFEAGNDMNLLNIYKRLVKIPLYQYARYYKAFSEMNKDHEIEQVIDEDALAQYLEKYGKSSVSDLSIVEKHQIIDEYSHTVFSRTQALVNVKWNYESTITVADFSPRLADEIDKQSEEWTKYLDYEINALKAQNVEEQHKIITQLFERCLVPNCLSSKFWLKYLAYIHFHYQGEDRFEKARDIYNRAIFTFVPLDQNFIRYNYVTFLMNNDKFDVANEYLLDLIKLFGGTNNKKLFLKDHYLEAITKTVSLWSITVPMYEKVLEELITNYFERIDRYKKESTEPKDDEKKVVKFDLKPSYISAFQKLLNGDAICVVIAAYLNYNKLNSDTNTPKKLRTFFNRYHKEPEVRRSTLFWKFYLEYEALIEGNFLNAKNIIEYIKTSTSLPKSVVDSLVDLNFDIISANFGASLKQLGRPDDSLIFYDNDISNSLTINKSARERVAANNYVIQDLEESKLARGSRQYSQVDKKEEVIRLAKKHADHPGIIVESTPEITNKIMNEGNWISLDSHKTVIPPLPSFKNVEKASLPIPYPKDV